METWEAQQDEVCKAQGVRFACFMVRGETFLVLPANKQQNMSGANARLGYTCVSNEGAMQQVAIILQGSLRGLTTVSGSGNIAKKAHSNSKSYNLHYKAPSQMYVGRT